MWCVFSHRVLISFERSSLCHDIFMCAFTQRSKSRELPAWVLHSWWVKKSGLRILSEMYQCTANASWWHSYLQGLLFLSANLLQLLHFLGKCKAALSQRIKLLVQCASSLCRQIGQERCTATSVEEDEITTIWIEQAQIIALSNRESTDRHDSVHPCMLIQIKLQTRTRKRTRRAVLKGRQGK